MRLGFWLGSGLLGLLLVALYLLSSATENSALTGPFYPGLLLLNALGILFLAALLGAWAWRLAAEYRERAAGARLTARLAGLFLLLSVAPVSVVYLFSVQFLQRGIESWFDVRIEQALKDSLELARLSLQERVREMARQTQQMAQTLARGGSALPGLELFEMRVGSDASALMLLDLRGNTLASSEFDPSVTGSDRPHELVLQQVRQGIPYLDLEPVGAQGFQARVVMPVPDEGGTEPRLLQAIFPISERLNELAGSVQTAMASHGQLAVQREELKHSFVITLSLALLVSVLAAALAALYSARQLVAPVRHLVQGTRRVAAGDYGHDIPVTGSDDLAYLVRSFNAMTRRVGAARQAAEESRQQAEDERAYLGTVLAHLASGVLALDAAGRLRTANAAAARILDAPLETLRGQTPAQWAEGHAHLAPLVELLARNTARPEWREEMTLFGVRGRQMLVLTGAALPGEQPAAEHVVVIEDVTALVQAQRDAAWGEVARRLAHEIKNPLTPIRLSAERLRLKCLPRMQGEESALLDRATHTIVQQVEAMKDMVNAFAQYARAPELKPVSLDLDALIREVAELYGGVLELRLQGADLRINADAGRLRQLLHNLIKNALEAVEGREGGQVRITTRRQSSGTRDCLLLEVEDNGPGFPPDLPGGPFEPYATTKARGTGLGLPVVKRIVEEHSGMIEAGNRPEGGARVAIRLPLAEVADNAARAQE